VPRLHPRPASAGRPARAARRLPRLVAYAEGPAARTGGVRTAGSRQSRGPAELRAVRATVQEVRTELGSQGSAATGGLGVSPRAGAPRPRRVPDHGSRRGGAVRATGGVVGRQDGVPEVPR